MVPIRTTYPDKVDDYTRQGDKKIRGVGNQVHKNTDTPAKILNELISHKVMIKHLCSRSGVTNLFETESYFRGTE